jgi:V-type H+-transporting ATPase proteolipid subunit
VLTPNSLIVYGDPNQALFFGGMGIVAALVFGNMGAAYGTAKSGVGICSVAVLKPELIIKSIIPVVMAGILGIYGLIISVIISGSCKSYLLPLTFLLTIPLSSTVKAVPYDENIMKAGEWQYNYALGYKQLASGLCCGLSSLAAGLAIGVVGDAGVRANGQKNILIALILMMIFAEALALYGFIIAIVLVMSS